MKKNYSRLLLALVCLTFVLVFSINVTQYQASTYTNVSGQVAPNPQFVPSDIQPADNSISIGVWVINVFDYEYVKSDYTLDLYVYFFWTTTNLTTIDWNFANGYPITPTSVTLIRNDSASSVRYEIYRATARLNSPPDASNFPFDTVNITASINVFTHGNTLVLNWLQSETGIDSQFTNPGWKTISVNLSTATQSYPLGVQVPRADMVITQQRQRANTSYAPFVPPTIFALVCAVSFLFGLKEGGSVALRIGLNTSMLVTTLLFSFGVSGGIPPASNIVLYTMFLLSVLIFMVCNLVVTIIGVVGWVRYKNEKRTTLANRLGFLISIVVPIVFFLLLYLVRT